jgi:glucose/arabinose dehydrogenase
MTPPLRVLTRSALFVAAAAWARADGDPAHGKVIFQQNCALCHGTGLAGQTTSGQGPLLAGVFGRPAAALPNFSYSKALRASNLTWDAPTLNAFLKAPTVLVPGTNMVIAVPGDSDRADLVAFLATLPKVAEVVPAALPQHPRTPGDWQNDAPGAVHRFDLAHLPPPYATKSAGNTPKVVDRPAGAELHVPAGFEVKLLLANLDGPRLMRTAPNGDIFLAETREGRVRVLRLTSDGTAIASNTVFATGLKGPFGIAFYPQGAHPKWVYVGEQNQVVRFPYQAGDERASGPATVIVPQLSPYWEGGHSTRDLAFSPDNRRLFISVGSASNDAEGDARKTAAEIAAWDADRGRGAAWGPEENRADILVTDPEGRAPLRRFATGIRNAVGLAVQPATGVLWCSTNERDHLGDDLVPDYITRVKEGEFYGWPWYYMGDHEDPRHAGERPDLPGHIAVPDVPEQPHSASLELTFYPEHPQGASAFPPQYRGDIFAALHGSWNRTGRTGSKVIRIHLKHGVPTGEYEDFLVGWVINDRDVWGRPVGVTVAPDGALLVTDDAAGTLWRISTAGH